MGAILDLLFYAKSCNLTFKFFGNMASKKQEKYYKMYPISTPVWFHKLNKTKPGKKTKKTFKWNQSEMYSLRLIWTPSPQNFEEQQNKMNGIYIKVDSDL